jgi:hypothetical protein
LAEYFGIEAIWVRVAFILLAIINGAGVLLYIILAIVIPKESLEGKATAMRAEDTLGEGAQNLQERAREITQSVREGRGPQLLGWVLVALGVWFLLRQLGWLRVSDDIIFPILLIGIGVLVLMRQPGGRSSG